MSVPQSKDNGLRCRKCGSTGVAPNGASLYQCRSCGHVGDARRGLTPPARRVRVNVLRNK